MIYQRTLASATRCSGTGLHSGKEVSLTLRPACANTGIIFTRTDLSEPVTISVGMKAISASSFATSLENRGVSVTTVEHLLATISALGIDNVIIEVDAPEVPIMDGSAAPFVALIENAGVVEQSQPRNYVVIRKPIKVTENGRWIEIRPSRNTRISYTVDFEHPMISKQFYETCFPGRAFQKEISPARTFGFLSDVAELRSKGYALGGSLENAVVMDDFGVLNEEGLRFPDEFVRHKILDLLGDLCLLGHPLIGHVIAHKSGHALNHELLREVISSPECWEVTELSEIRTREMRQAAMPFRERQRRASV